MAIAEAAFIILATIWCGCAWRFADPPPVGTSSLPRRAIALLCVALPVAAGLLISLPVGAFAAAAVLALTLGWWLRLSPRDLGGWETEYEKVPRTRRDGSLMRVSDIRNFRYRSVSDPIPAYYDATFDIDTLTGLDLICSYWAGESIAHIFLSFGFADGRHLAVSVETRRKRGQTYSSIAGFFRHYQLMFVIADERDLIGVRTDIRRERVYLYPLRATADERKRLFCGYMNRAEALAERPEFYNTLLNNCTTNIVSLIDGGLPRGERLGWDWRLLFSGYADRFVHEIGRMDTDLPFAAFKARSRIVRPSGSVIGDDFSRSIRSVDVTAPAPPG